MKFKINRTDIDQFLFRHQSKINSGVKICTAIVEAGFKKSFVPLIGGVLEVARANYSDNWNYSYFLSKVNGWNPIVTEYGFTPASIFKEILSGLNPTKIGTQHGSGVLIYDSPFGEVAIVELPDSHSDRIWIKTDNELSIEEFTSLSEKVTDWLVNERVSQFNSNFLSVEVKDSAFGKTEIKLAGVKIVPIQSPKSNEYTDFIKKCIDKNIHRSIMFYGPPGTGKTTLAQTIISNLNLRTLKFTYGKAHFGWNFLYFIIDKFKFDAIMIDDFDQTKESAELLEFLEVAKRKCKLVISMANNLQAFNPAVIRPGRHDSIILIDELDSKTIDNLLGNISEKYFEKVRKWPVAYILELKTRSEIYPSEQLEEHYEELKSRVEKQLTKLTTA